MNDVLIVGNSAEQGYNQTRIENVPGDILGYDLKTGKFLWKFHVIPRPGEFGHDTWENDAWRWTGDVSSWAPMSADPARGLVYVPTNGATIDYYGGFRPGDNLFSTSIIALDVKTGKRVWHQQLVKHDIWNYDTPTAPDPDGRHRRRTAHSGALPDYQAVATSTPTTASPASRSGRWRCGRRRSRRCPARSSRRRSRSPPSRSRSTSRAARNRISSTTRPRSRSSRSNGRRRKTCSPSSSNRPRHRGNAEGRGPANICPGGGGGANITGPPAADPAIGFVFIATTNGCSPTLLQPAKERDNEKMTGKTLADWVPVRGGPPPAPRMASDPLAGIPDIFKGPLGKVVAIDMNTGEHAWMIPHGDMAQNQQDAFKANPLLKGVDRRHQLGTPRPPGPGGYLHAAAGHGPDRRQQAEPVRHRQEDRQARGFREHAAPRSVRPDDLHAPGQAVHRAAGERRLHHDGAALRRPGRSGGSRDTHTRAGSHQGAGPFRRDPARRSNAAASSAQRQRPDVAAELRRARTPPRRRAATTRDSAGRRSARPAG